jgi:hypothetical protein
MEIPLGALLIAIPPVVVCLMVLSADGPVTVQGVMDFALADFKIFVGAAGLGIGLIIGGVFLIRRGLRTLWPYDSDLPPKDLA